MRVYVMNAQKIGQMIRNLRNKIDISQTTLSEWSGVSQRRISRIENAAPTANIPSSEELNALADALGIPVSDILGYAGYDVTATEEDRTLLVEGFWARRTANLTDDQRKHLIALAESYRSTNVEHGDS